MRASIYNNPLFAEGLAALVEQYIGNPEREIDLQRAQLGLEQEQMRTADMRAKMQGQPAIRSGGGRAPRAAPPQSGGLGDIIAPAMTAVPADPAVPALGMPSAAVPAASPMPAMVPQGGPGIADLFREQYLRSDSGDAWLDFEAMQPSDAFSDETAIIMQEAAEAIRQGADPAAVAARLRELGISTSGR